MRRSRKGRGEVVKIKDLFAVYKQKLRAPQSSVIKEMQCVATDLLGYSFKTSDFTYTVSTRTLVVQKSGPLKSELLLRKEEILLHLKGRLGEKSVPKEIL